MKSNAYEPTTIRQTKKRLRYLMSNCNTNRPEEVKKFVSSKDCSNAYKECLIETYDIYMQSKNKRWDKPFYSRYDKKRKAPKEQLIDFRLQKKEILARQCYECCHVTWKLVPVYCSDEGLAFTVPPVVTMVIVCTDELKDPMFPETPFTVAVQVPLMLV